MEGKTEKKSRSLQLTGDLVETKIIGQSVRIYITAPRHRTQIIPAPNPNHTTPREILCKRQPNRLQPI